MTSPFMIGLIVVFLLVFIKDWVNDTRDHKERMMKIANEHRNDHYQDWEL